MSNRTSKSWSLARLQPRSALFWQVRRMPRATSRAMVWDLRVDEDAVRTRQSQADQTAGMRTTSWCGRFLRMRPSAFLLEIGSNSQ